MLNRFTSCIKYEGSIKRAFHSNRQVAKNGTDLPKPKPKAILRRTAAEQSAPVRSKLVHSPGRSDVMPVNAFSTAERYDFASLAAGLKSYNSYLVPDTDGAIYIPLENGKKEVFVFRSGSFVTWGMDSSQGERFLRQVIRRGNSVTPNSLQKVLVASGRWKWTGKNEDNGTAGWVEKNRYLDYETEQLDYVIDPSESTRLQGDLIVLGKEAELNTSLSTSIQSLTPTGTQLQDTVYPVLLSKYAFSHALSRSAKLSALESQLSTYLSKVSSIPAYLALNGHIPPEMDRKAIASSMGELLRFRQGLNLELDNEGENFWGVPDVLWDEQVLESYFQQVSEVLDIKPRVDAVNQKITYAADVQATLRDYLQTQTSHRMELIIIALITVEVALAIITHGREIYLVMTESEDDQNMKEEHQNEKRVA